MPTYDTSAYIDVVAAEVGRLLAAVRRTDLDTVVQTTPEWTVADLTWHLAEVQWLWGAVVADLLQEVDGLEEPGRPADEDLPALLERRGDDLVALLRRRDPDDRCWSWKEDGASVGWVARRQAHEALIHRVDAEVAAGGPVTDADPALAADGIDELLVDMLRPPSWTTLTPDGQTIRVQATDVDRSWTVRFARLTGTSPSSGRSYDQDAVLVTPDGDREVADAEVGAVVSGRAWDLDRWLWGRGPADPLRRAGDHALLHRLRSAAEVD